MNSAVRALLIEQAGVISRSQLREAGLTDRQIDYLPATGDWGRDHAGVFRSLSVAPTPESRVRAAALWLGPKATLDGQGAAWWWQMTSDPPTRWRFVTTKRSAATELDLRRGFVDPRDRTVERGIHLVTRPLAVLRTAVDLERVRPGDGIVLIDRAKQKRWADHAELQTSFMRHAGTWGATRARTLLDRTGGRAHSELEREAVRLLTRAGITGFEPNYRATLADGSVVELDLAFPDRGFAIELDGYAFHSSPEALRADLQRANAIMASGWTVRRFTWSDVLGDPEGFVAQVREVLEAEPH